MSKEVSLLWTGGWDSTFRLVELSFEDIDIYPVYVIDPNRKSRDIEQKRMGEIVQALNEKPLTKARIHQIETIRLDDIPKNPQISEAYEIVRKKTQLGSQHEWLARLGSIKPGMEMGTEAGSPETSHILYAIQEFGRLIVEDGVGFLDPQQSSPEGMLVLGWFSFPIITRTEQEMVQTIKQWGYEDVMKKIWFCHTPRNGEPCGLCHPCEVKIESDMAFLLPPRALTCYRIYRASSRILGSGASKAIRSVLKKL